MSTTVLRRLAPLAALFAVALAGCTGATVRGYVTRGGISTVTVTSENDARVSGPGIAGVGVTLIEEISGGADRVVGRAISGEDGAFRVGWPSRERPKGLVRVVAEREGFVTARASTYVPGAGEIWLVLLEPRSRDAAPAGSEAGPARTPGDVPVANPGDVPVEDPETP